MGRNMLGARHDRSDAPEIELIAPRAELFGPTASTADDERVVPWGATDVEPDSPGAKWATLVAVVVVAGFVGLGVVMAAPWRSGSTGSGARSGRPVTAGAPAVSLPVIPSVATGVLGPDGATVVDPSAGGAGTNGTGSTTLPPAYVLALDALPAGSTADGGMRTTDALGGLLVGGVDPSGPQWWFELWATPAAGRTSGRWLSIETGDGGWDWQSGPGERVPMGSRTVVRAALADGVDEVRFQLGDASATIDSFGVDRADVLRIAEDLTIRGPRAVVPDHAIPPDLLHVTSMPSTGRGLRAMLGLHTTAVATYAGTGDDAFVRVSTMDAGAVLALWPFVESRDPGGTTPTDADVELGGRLVHLHLRDGAPPGSQTAWFAEGGRLVSIESSLDRAALLRLVAAAHPGDDAEWFAMQRGQSPPGDVSADETGVGATSPTTASSASEVERFDPLRGAVIGSGTTASGESWEARVSVTPSGHVAVSFEPPGAAAADEVVLLGEPPVAIRSTSAGTYVACVQPADRAPSSMTVTVGPQTFVAKFVPIDAAGSMRGAAVAFSETGLFAVYVDGVDGWPPIHLVSG